MPYTAWLVIFPSLPVTACWGQTECFIARVLGSRLRQISLFTRSGAHALLPLPAPHPSHHQAPSPWNELIKGVFKNISLLHLHVLHHWWEADGLRICQKNRKGLASRYQSVWLASNDGRKNNGLVIFKENKDRGRSLNLKKKKNLYFFGAFFFVAVFNDVDFFFFYFDSCTCLICHWDEHIGRLSAEQLSVWCSWQSWQVLRIIGSLSKGCPLKVEWTLFWWLDLSIRIPLV